MRLLLTASLLFSLVPDICAQYDYGSSSDSTSTSTSASGTSSTSTAASSSSASGIHRVNVGNNGFIFDPDTVNAAVGDTVQFFFYPGNHSVVQSEFTSPCQAKATGIFSGFFPGNDSPASTIFTIAINNTNPIWVYCAQVTHCQSRMALVINPPANGPDTLSAYKLAAKGTNSSSIPAGVQGGVLGPQQNATTASATSSSSPSPSSSANGLQRTWLTMTLTVISSALWALIIS